MKAGNAALPTPHHAKLRALRGNRRLSARDKPRVEEAIRRYHQWIAELERVPLGHPTAVEDLVAATNRYWLFFELDFVFDSPEDFLYRQKGQLKLDNTILEEFLPHLLCRGLRGLQGGFEFGPRSTFAGMTFTSSLGNPGIGGNPSLRTKNQDFILGKKLYVKTSFDSDFESFDLVKSHLGYICAECKTNLDKTMFQEAVATSRDLKIAVPNSLYFLVCEFLDMTPVSIVSTQIDDVLIVRKAKRMSSNVRQQYTNCAARRERRGEYVDFLNACTYRPDVFQRMLAKVQELIDDTAPDVDKVIGRGHF